MCRVYRSRSAGPCRWPRYQNASWTANRHQPRHVPGRGVRGLGREKRSRSVRRRSGGHPRRGHGMECAIGADREVRVASPVSRAIWSAASVNDVPIEERFVQPQYTVTASTAKACWFFPPAAVRRGLLRQAADLRCDLRAVGLVGMAALVVVGRVAAESTPGPGSRGGIGAAWGRSGGRTRRCRAESRSPGGRRRRRGRRRGRWPQCTRHSDVLLVAAASQTWVV